MLYHSNFSKSYWGEALFTTTYLQNRQPIKIIYSISSYELWIGRIPSATYLRVFGCTAYALVFFETQLKSTIPNKSIECWFLGYGSSVKGYRLQTKQI